MNIEEKNNSEETYKVEGTPSETKRTFKDKTIVIFRNNKAAIVLTALLLVVSIGFFIKTRINEKKINNEKTQLITNYESKIDSLQIKHLKLITEVFSWSVRSELLRKNNENLNQLLTVFVKESGADLVQLINPENNVVLISSDKKFEGSTITDTKFEDLTSTIVLNEENNIKILSPVMGFNKNIGILIVEIKSSESDISKAESGKFHD
jgi:hypothetical protein